MTISFQRGGGRNHWRDSWSEPSSAFSTLLYIKIQSLEHGLAEMKETQVGKLFLDILAGWFFQAHLDLVNERSRPLIPGAEEELAAGPGRERAAQSGSEFLRHLGGSVFGVCYPEPQDGVVGLARPLLEVHESVPGPIQQIVAPGINDPFVQILQSRSADDGHLHVGVQPAGLTLAPMVIDHQVPDGSLDVIAEATDTWVVLEKIALEKAKGKLLVELLDFLGVAHGLQQVTVHRPGVAEHHEPQCVANLFGCTMMRLKEHGPLCG